MHQQSLQGATQTPQDGALWRSRPRSGPPLWAWLLLGVLMVPGARSFLSEEKEEMLVELHNYYRGQVSPSASAMMPLKWDPALKLIAEDYAAKCIWNHNPELEDTGENLFAGTGSLDLREALEKWFLERLDYNFQNNSCHEDKMCGHYTQMVWADTHRVGCAFHLCNTMEGLDWERASFLVCNYFPAGNYEGERPYVEGDWCSRCPENLLRCENNLCVADIEEDDEEDATVVPPPATSEPSLKAEEEESAADVQPGTTAAPSTTSSTSTTSGPTGPNPEDNGATATPALSTRPSEVSQATEDASLTDASSTTGPEEEAAEKTEEKEKKQENKQGIAQIIFHNKAATSSGSVFSPSVLWAGLTGLLALRL